MPDAIDFPASELRDIVRDGAFVRLRLSAAAARNEVGERGWLTGVTLAFAHATLHGEAEHAFGSIAEGSLRHDGGDVRRLPVPVALEGVVELALRLANGTQVVIRAGALESSLADGGCFREDFSC